MIKAASFPLAGKSTVDRVLLLAAAVCAAGLVWQVSILLTGKGQLPMGRGIDVASAATAAPGSTTVSPASSPEAGTPAIRVVYPGPDAPKTTLKASDAVPPAPAIAPASATPPASLVPPAVADAAEPPAASVVPASTDIAAPGPVATAPKAVPTSPPAPVRMASAEVSPPSPTPAVEPKPAGGALDINSASVEALNRLHGGGHIGQAIASHRPYKSVDDLVKRRVLRRDVLDRIRGQIAAQ